jgi:hypothetical protein
MLDETKRIYLNKKETKMSDEKTEKHAFDIDFEKPPEKGKACHMQVDEDLHSFINTRRLELDVTFRKLANELLCRGIQQYIQVKKLPSKIRNRTK